MGECGDSEDSSSSSLAYTSNTTNIFSRIYIHHQTPIGSIINPLYFPKEYNPREMKIESITENCEEEI